MNLNSIPPLLTSDTDPIIVANKKFQLEKLDPLYFKAETINSELDNFGLEGSYNDIVDHYASRKPVSNGVCESKPEREGSFSSLPPETNSTYKIMSSWVHRDCHLKSFRSCYAMVKKDYSRSSQSHVFQFGSHSSLPGYVDDIRTEPDHRTETYTRNRISRFWNSELQLSRMKQNEKFAEYSRHFLLQMLKFISKLKQAVTDEQTYVKKLDVVKTKYISAMKCSKEKFESSDSLYDSNSSGVFVADDENDDSDKYSIRPPKLGKVYAELQMHFKAWNDIMQKWRACRLEVDQQMLAHLRDVWKRMKIYQRQMLLLTEELIHTRLHSFACCVTLRSKNEEAERDWDYVLGSGSLKRLCKLIDVYNKLLKNHLQENTTSPQLSQMRSLSLSDALSTSKENSQRLLHGQQEKETLQFFSISRILNVLAVPGKRDLASSLLSILAVVHQNKSDSFNDYEAEVDGKRGPQYYQVDWGNATAFDIDEDHVISQVSGYEVPDISRTNLSNESLSSVKQLLYAQGSFIVTFLNCLASNTSLLRGNLRSKSPRSVTSSQALHDDISAINSDDETSSVASSSFFSQLSGFGGGHATRRKKTVLWRDSWDQEAVKSLSKSFMACMVTEGPSQCLIAQANDPDADACLSRSSFHDDDSGVNDHTANSGFLQAAKFFRPRFWSDAQTLTLDACVTNMITFEILPADVLENVQESTQAFIVEKALQCWDSSLSLALGVSTNDKCGRMPIQSSAALSKTAWSYVKALHALMFIMERYHGSDDVAQQALPRLEATLDSFYRWCHGKIQHFMSSWSIGPLLQVCLGDLSQLTALGLESLQMVAKCHNHVESRRMLNPASLHLATKHLNNIDAIITAMQSLSGDCMKTYVKKCMHLCKNSIEATFPSQKIWRQTNLTDHSCASKYMIDSVKSIIAPICSAVSTLDARRQHAAVPPVVAAMLNSVIKLILQRSVPFSIQGALQLQRDFEYVIDYVCSEDASLCGEVRRAVTCSKPVERALWVVNTLQRTDVIDTNRSAKVGYQKSKRRNGRSLSPAVDEYSDEVDECDWTAKEKEFLALRVHAGGRKRCKTFFSLPCSDNAMD